MKVLSLVALLGSSSCTYLSNEMYYSTGDEEWTYLMTQDEEPIDIMNVQYGDVTVTIAKRTGNEAEEIPDRYSADSDDKLMNTLIKKGYAFSKSKTNSLKVELDCGCNCNCCFGQTLTDAWELSKNCGCDCGCCNMNHYNLKQNPQFWINKEGAEKATREIVQKNLHLTGQKLDEYMTYNFGDAWEHYDVLGTGLVEVEQMSSFMKRVLKDYTISLQ